MALTNLGGAVAVALPVIAVAGPALASEGTGSGTALSYTVTVARNGQAGAIPFTWSVAGSGASPASASDFVGGVLPGGSDGFAAGETSRTLTVTLAGDAAVEADERFTLTVAATLPLAVASATTVIANDDVTVPMLLMGSRFNLAGFNGYAGSDGTDTNSNYRLASWNETGAGVLKARAYFANWLADATNERDGYGPITVSAGIEYPAGTITPLTFAGAASTTIAASGTASLAESDEATLSVPVPAGAQYWVRTYVSVASGSRWPQGYLVNTGNGEAADWATGVDRTAAGTIANMAAAGTRRGYGPVAVKATAFDGAPVAKAFATVGDSLIMGSTDVLEAASRGNIGYAGKALAGYCPVVNLGIAGTSAMNNAPANFARRAALLAKAGITHVFADWSVNDVMAGRSAAQLASDVAGIAAGLKAAVPGVKVVWATLTPRTSSTDGWKTVANQTPFATPAGAFTGGAGSARSQFNATLRAGMGGVDAVFEAADTAETARDSGLWRAGEGSTHLTNTGATSDASTSDGLHPTTMSTTAPGLGGIYVLRDAMKAAVAGW